MTNFSSLAVSGVRGLSPYQPGKPIDELERELGIKNIIKLASNENPLGTPATAIRAIEKALPQLALYPDGSAFGLKSKLAGKLSVDAAQMAPMNYWIWSLVFFCLLKIMPLYPAMLLSSIR